MEQTVCIDNITYNFSGKSAEATAEILTSQNDDLKIPNKITLDCGTDLHVTGLCAESYNTICDIESIMIPDSVKKIFASRGNGNAFIKFVDLENIHVSPDNKHFKSVDGVLFTKDGTVLLSYPIGRMEQEYTVPDGVEIISESAFMKSRLKHIHLPDSLHTIKQQAFRDSKIREIIMPEKLRVICDDSFEDCGKLKFVDLSKALEHVGERSFARCEKLERVIVRSANVAFGDAAFDSCNKAKFELVLSPEQTKKDNHGNVVIEATDLYNFLVDY